MTTKRLIDTDGSLSSASFGATINGDDVTAIPADGYYLVKAVASADSELPDGIAVGYLVWLTTSDVPATGDDVQPVTFNEMCYVQNGTISPTKGELETTTICDGIKTYRAGRTDISGSFDGVSEAGNADVLALINRFVDTVQMAADGSTATVSEQNDGIFYLQLETNKTSTANEPVEFFLMPITILTAENGISLDSTQTFTSTFRVTSDGVNNVKPAFYSRAVV